VSGDEVGGRSAPESSRGRLSKPIAPPAASARPAAKRGPSRRARITAAPSSGASSQTSPPALSTPSNAAAVRVGATSAR
jgi:hypothetical protein